MWIIAAFLILGLLIGNLTGFTVDSVVGSLITLLFAFGGGSAIAFVKDLDQIARKHVGQTILALSIGCLLGIYMSIYISEHQLFTPLLYRASPKESTIDSRKVLRSDLQKTINTIDQLYRDSLISAQDAYESLYESVKQSESKKK